MLSIIAGHMGQAEDLFWIYSYHVAVFFILSGYTFKEKPLSAGYLKNSFKRLMIPYFITCLLIIIFDPVKNFILSGTSSVYDLTEIIYSDIADSVFASGTSNYIVGINTGSHIGAIWFLPALFFARIFTQIILKHIKLWNRRLLAGLGMLILAFFLNGLELQLPFSLVPAFCATFFVLAGMFLRERRIFEKMRARHYIAALLTVFLICLYGVFSGSPKIISIGLASSRFTDPFICVISTLCASIVVIRIAMFAEKCRFLSWIGKNSLTVLCVHLFTLKIVQDFILRYIFPLFPLELTRGTYIYTIILAAFHVLICCIAVLVSKPLLNWWRQRVRISYQDTNTTAVSGRSLSAYRSDTDKTLLISKAIIAVLVISLPLDLYGTFRTLLNTFVFAALALIQGYCLGRDLKEIKEMSGEENAGHFRRRVFADRLKESVTELLIPYAVFGVFYILTRDAGLAAEIKILVNSTAVSGKYLAYYSTIGVAWIIPAIFFAQIIYAFILSVCKKKYTLTIAVLIVSALGVVFGVQEIFLPCSLDMAFFMVVFFYAGHMFYEYDLVRWYISRPWLYFIAAASGAYILYSCTINYADREYGIWALCVLGGISGTLIIFNAAHFTESRITSFIGTLVSAVSRSAFFVILSCALLQPILQGVLSDLAELAEKGMANGIICCVTELIVGTIAGEIYYAAAGCARRLTA